MTNIEDNRAKISLLLYYLLLLITDQHESMKAKMSEGAIKRIASNLEMSLDEGETKEEILLQNIRNDLKFLLSTQYISNKESFSFSYDDLGYINKSSIGKKIIFIIERNIEEYNIIEIRDDVNRHLNYTTILPLPYLI